MTKRLPRKEKEALKRIVYDISPYPLFIFALSVGRSNKYTRKFLRKVKILNFKAMLMGGIGINALGRLGYINARLPYCRYVKGVTVNQIKQWKRRKDYLERRRKP